MMILGYIPDEDWVKQILGFGEMLNSDIEVLTTKHEVAEVAEKYFSKIYSFELEIFNLIGVKKALKTILRKIKPDIFVSPCTNKGRAVSGIFMGLFKCSGVSDIIDIEVKGDVLEVERLVYGGTAKASVKIKIPTALCIAPGYFKGSSKNIKSEVIEMGKIENGVVGEFRAKEVTGNDPTKADIVIVAGRGVKEKSDLNMIIELADKLKGAWSVTRPLAADYGWTDSWVGISGLVVNPKLYIGVGVSGQPHHMMGARNSKIIIAINKDPEAPIFEEADYGLVGDLYKIIPVLLKKFK